MMICYYDSLHILQAISSSNLQDVSTSVLCDWNLATGTWQLRCQRCFTCPHVTPITLTSSPLSSRHSHYPHIFPTPLTLIHFNSILYEKSCSKHFRRFSFPQSSQKRPRLPPQHIVPNPLTSFLLPSFCIHSSLL